MGRHCLKTSDKVKLILTKLPMTLSIQQISDVSGYHRNTVRPALNSLVTQKAVKLTSTNRNRDYYSNNLADFYRKIAAALPSAAVAQKTGYNFVYSLLKKNISQTKTKIARADFKEFQEIINLAYPFIDFSYQQDGSILPISKITITNGDKNKRFLTFHAIVEPCLCNGEDTSGKSCAMVQGSLQATTDFIFEGNSIVRRLNNTGRACTYSIKIPVSTQQNSLKKAEEPKLDVY